jgi:lia operon protein LiaG
MVIAYGLGAIIMFVSPKSVFSNEKSNFSIDEKASSKLDGINSINIGTSSTSINIIPTDENEVSAHFYGKVITSSAYQNPELECYTDGDTLRINTKNKNSTSFNFGFFSSNLKLDIYIPKSYSKELILSSSSGSINIKDIKVKSLSCSSSSGSTYLENVTADEFIQNSSSGSLKADGLFTSKTTSSSSSGSRNITNFTGDLITNSSSGSTNVEYSTFDNDIKANSSSGSIKIKLPDNAEFYLDASTSSGGIDCEFPITITESKKRNKLAGVVGSDKNNIRINCSSGSIDIRK